MRTTVLAVLLTTGVALPVAFVAIVGYGRVFHEEAGPKLRRECVSLVDTVLKEHPTVATVDLISELKNRGVVVEPRPDLPSSLPNDATWVEKMKEYEAAKKAWDAKWEEIERSQPYSGAWDAVFEKKREKAIRECVYQRAVKEGVTAR